MAETLTGVTGTMKGTVLHFDQGEEWIIGSDPKSQLVIDEPDIASRHALIKKSDRGLTLENLSPTNPTLLNNEPFDEPRPLNEGDQIQIGTSSFNYSRDGLDSVSSSEPQDIDEHHNTLFEENSDNANLTQVHFDLLDTGRWTLKVVAGPNNGAEFPLQSGQTYLIGTDASHCDIIFHDISVSRQHARISLKEDGSLILEDLGSRNGTFIEEDKVEGTRSIETNKLITVGTSTFIIIDNEGERNTIISPLLPSIVKVLQKEIKKDEVPAQQSTFETEEVEEEPKKPRFSLLGAFILITLISGIFALAGVAFSTLFKTHEIAKQTVDYNEELKKIVSNYPAVRYSYNEPLGRLLLVGHVLTAVDRSQLLYDLHSLPFVKDIDDNIVIDEFVWREINQVLAQNPDWRGVAVIAPSPGKFILTGYLETRKQGDSLGDYINQNFPYPDLLENRVVVKDDLIAKVTIILRNNNLVTVNPVFSDGDIKLVGSMVNGMKPNLDKAIDEIKALPGIRAVINFVIEQKPQDAVINISDKYKVTGSTSQGGSNTNVVINGKLLQSGDAIDGMRVIDIQPNYVLLEKNGIRYRIDYNQY